MIGGVVGQQGELSPSLAESKIERQERHDHVEPG